MKSLLIVKTRESYAHIWGIKKYVPILKVMIWPFVMGQKKTNQNQEQMSAREWWVMAVIMPRAKQVTEDDQWEGQTEQHGEIHLHSYPVFTPKG